MVEKTLRYLIVVAFAFIAQIIDSTIGMGYGVSLSTLLLSIGIGSAIASATVHFSEVFTSFFSGLSHFKLGNFDKKTFSYLVVPGVIGGIIGTLAAIKFQEVSEIKLAISVLLFFLGFLIIIKHLRKKQLVEYKIPRIRKLVPLGFSAAFIDAIGGGGWGPVTTPTLVAGNADPKKTIGSVNAAEFFVTLAISITFLIFLPSIDWNLLLFVIIGGLIASPISAYLVKRIRTKNLAILVGIFIMILSVRNIISVIL